MWTGLMGGCGSPLTWLRWASRMNFKVWPGLPITSCLRTGPEALSNVMIFGWLAPSPSGWDASWA